ncbi:AMP-binding protein, partial [Rhodococcus jostii]|uniref:class I adenylate-forming enzyme family protein n=1 Tax=Rhodococcus jostii TaxID=132919 RepID=UPI003644C83B
LFETEDRTIRGVPTTVFKYAPTTLLDVFTAARGHGDRPFLVYEDERVSYQGFARAAVVVAHVLAGGGVRPGDRVAVVMANVPQWPVVFYGAVLAGAIVVPLNAWWTGPELAHAVTDSEATVVIVDRERLDRLHDALPSCRAVRRIYLTRGSGRVHDAPWVTSMDIVLGDSARWAGLPYLSAPDVWVGPDDDATIFYTSGTTGKPKGAVGTHRNACTVAFAAGFGPARTAVRRGDPIPTADPDAPPKCVLVSVPLFHVTGSLVLLNSAMLAGDRIVLMSRFDPGAALELIEREKCTTIGGVPTIAWQLLQHPDRPRFDLTSIETVNYGGAPAPATLVDRITDTWAHAVPAQGWGMTESSGTFTSHGGEDYVARPTSCGLAFPTGEMRIVDDTGHVLLPSDHVGELWVRGASVVRGYWNNPAATHAAFHGGWLRTGDLARIDRDGYLHIVDRTKDMIIRGGKTSTARRSRPPCTPTPPSSTPP